MSNPLVEEHALPPFERISIEHIEPAIDEGIAHVFQVLDQQLDALGTESPTWANLVAPLEEAGDKLEQSWSPVSHLNGVKNSDDLREVYERCIQKLTEFGTAIDQHGPLYQAYEKLAASDAYQDLSEPQKAVIEHTLRDFRLAGVALPEDKKQRYGEIKKKLSTLSNQFSNNVLDSTQAWFCHFDDATALAGLPDSALAMAEQMAQQRDVSGYVVTLDMPSYLSVITYADDRALREKIYHAFATRASQESVVDADKKQQWDNTPLIEEKLALRHELAILLGFANYAELSLATKMADTPEQVVTFLEGLAEKSLPSAQKDLEGLAEKSLPSAQKDLQELSEYATGSNTSGMTTVEALAAWDVPYYSEKLRQEKYSVSQEALRAYFPAQRVIEGLFSVVHRLFGITVEAVTDVECYHPDVSVYQIKKAGDTIAYFYFDIYARDKKRGGAWMADCRTRRLRTHHNGETYVQLPVAYLTCNFTPPVGDTPSLLTHQEVTTLFHEFGHGLHHMLTQMTDAAVSGISGVAWDAVELPSQFLENWCWEKSVIPMISGHYESGEPLPDTLLEKMLAAKNFQSGMQMVRQIEFSLFDILLHKNYDPTQVCDVQTVLDGVRKKVAVMTVPAFNKFQNGFSHIFAGGYAAGYYSYKWAEVLSADAFSLFEENGIFDQATGEQFLKTILANGGSQKPMDLFVAFRGREPSTEALLRHSGL